MNDIQEHEQCSMGKLSTILLDSIKPGFAIQSGFQDVWNLLWLAAVLCALASSLMFQHAMAETQQVQYELDQQEVEERLKNLEIDIALFKQQHEASMKQKSAIERQLEVNEKRISDLINQIHDTQEALIKGEARIAQLGKEQAELQAAKAEQQDYIAKQLRYAWQAGNQEFLKLLLNQEDPHDIDRKLTLHGYILAARARQVAAYSNTLAELLQVTETLAEANRQHLANRKSLQTRRQSLVETQAEKQQTLKLVVQEIAASGKQLKKSMQDQQQLEALLDKIRNSIAWLKEEAAESFKEMQGRLFMPLAGKIDHVFGQERQGSRLNWNGVFIAAKEGAAVHAVHPGRVVFSDWLRGYGLLLIISHGDGYMSLYGHNQVLYRRPGEWVEANDMIAAAGDTGGQDKSGLYFEIRVAGKPTNPQAWCKTRPASATI